ncbi:hypothetical protein SPI_06702 [Niveomyces insectorum RCEF 264]|uniref:Uncharacterized protein n=1 Tax=Niveomyces insectorum RCEF 264 TaxID=1081102 RepID=A0A167RID6_9HYPO|nr:hypothetical protein SPI_06702 [Niveomyces insectorum RCEF 264]
MVACLRDVPQSDLLALAATLRLLPDQLERIDTAGSDGPAGGRVAQPSAAWLADQAARIPALPPSLLRPAVCQPRLPPPCLCAAHRQLHPDLVRELFAYLTREVSIRADPLRRHPRHDIAGIGVKADSNNNKKCQSLDVREWGDRMLGLSALWCNNTLFSQLRPGGGGGGDDGTTATTGAAAFAWRLRDRPPHLALPCEACVLAVVGGRREALVDLRAGILCRLVNELEKRRRRQQQRAEKRAARVDEDGGGGCDGDDDDDNNNDDDDDNETVAGLLSSDVPHLLPVLEKYMVAFGPDHATVLRDLSMRLMMSLVPVRQCETRRRRLLAGQRQRRRRHHDVDTDNYDDDDDDDNKQHGSNDPVSEPDGPHHTDGDPPRLYTPSGHPLPLPLLPPDRDPYAGVAWDRTGCQAPFFASGTKAQFRASPAPAPALQHNRRHERPVISTPTLVSSSVYGTLDTCDVDDACVDEPYTVEEVDDCNGGDDGGDHGCLYVDDVGVDAYPPSPTTNDAPPNECPLSPRLSRPASQATPPLECEAPWGSANGRASTRLPMSPMSLMSPTSVYSYDNRDDGCRSRAAPVPPPLPPLATAAISAAAAERRRPYENMSRMRPSGSVFPDRKPAAPPSQHIPHTAAEYLSLQAEVARAFSMDSVAVGAAAAAAAAEARHKESAGSSAKARASAAVMPEQESQKRPRSQPSPQRQTKAPSQSPTREICETRTPASSPRTRPRQTPQPRPVPPTSARARIIIVRRTKPPTTPTTAYACVAAVGQEAARPAERGAGGEPYNGHRSFDTIACPAAATTAFAAREVYPVPTAAASPASASFATRDACTAPTATAFAARVCSSTSTTTFAARVYSATSTATFARPGTDPVASARAPPATRSAVLEPLTTTATSNHNIADSRSLSSRRRASPPGARDTYYIVAVVRADADTAAGGRPAAKTVIRPASVYGDERYQVVGLLQEKAIWL